MAGEDEAGRTPPTAEQAPQGQTQAQTTALQEPGAAEPTGDQPGGSEQPGGRQPGGRQPGGGLAEQPAGLSPRAAHPEADRPAATKPSGQPNEPGVTPTAAAAASDQPADPEPEQAEQPSTAKPGFGERGRMRRRSRFLRKARELAYRDLGGLVYDLHRFGQRNDPVVLAKLATLGHIDAELRALEQALHEIKPVTVLREVGIAACPRCAAIHGHEDRFCPGCGLAFAAGADRPLSTAPVTATPQGDAGAPAPTADASQPSGAPSGPVPASPGQVTGAQPAPASPADTSPRAAGEPPTTIERPSEPPPASPLRPTATPVAARPSAPEDGDGTRRPEDEPTQILRPPTESP